LTAAAASGAAMVETDIPARLDRLPWGRFHTLVVTALGITWVLDGLEVTLAGSLAGALKQSPVLQFSNTDVGLAASAYLAGAVLGALFFGWLTDRLGRKKLFFITLVVYLVATAATAASFDIYTFALCRFITGAGIGGEYAAINSTIQELIPARVRGWTDLVINGSFWVGAAIGAAGSLILLDPALIDPDHGWRLAFLIGAALALAIFFMRLWLPESPRWLMTHGRIDEANRIVGEIEAKFSGLPAVEETARVRLRARRFTPLREVAATLFRHHRQRTYVGLSLMAAQAFFYNAIFFTYALILTDFYRVPSDHIGWYLLPFAAGNFLGPVFLGRLFDSWGRRPMIALTYIVSGVLLALTGWLFVRDLITAETQTLCWMTIFFFASAAASAAYLTVSETFPIEIRALAIAFFYAIGTGLGGVAGPLLFGALIDTGSRASVFGGYLLGAGLMVLGSLVAWRFGVAAERKPLESAARAPSIALEDRLSFGGEGAIGAAVIARLHADRLRLRLGLDRLIDGHVPFLMQAHLSHGVGEGRPGCKLGGKRDRVRQHGFRLDQPVEEAPALALLRRHGAAGVEELRGAALADDARQDRAGTHVGAGKADAHEQKRGLGPRRADAHVGRHGEDRAGAGADAVHRGDDRLRTGAHRLDQIAGHAREGEKAIGVAVLLHLDQRADDFMHVAAGAEIAAGACEDDGLDGFVVDQLAKEIAQLAVGVEGERIFSLRPVQRDDADLALNVPLEMLGLVGARVKLAHYFFLEFALHRTAAGKPRPALRLYTGNSGPESGAKGSPAGGTYRRRGNRD
jgi:MFS family permease